jgi:hypothetical protein
MTDKREKYYEGKVRKLSEWVNIVNREIFQSILFSRIQVKSQT